MLRLPSRLQRLTPHCRNIEVKARIDRLSDVRARLASLPCRGEQQLSQTDTFFHVVRGRLKLRQFADGTGELIFYVRPDQAGPKLSQYDRILCQDALTVLRALSTALGVRGVVKKRRHVVLVGNTRIHLDEVEGLGSFVELEVVLRDSDSVSAGEQTAADLLRALGIPASSLISGAYLDLLEQR